MVRVFLVSINYNKSKGLLKDNTIPISEKDFIIDSELDSIEGSHNKWETEIYQKVKGIYLQPTIIVDNENHDYYFINGEDAGNYSFNDWRDNSLDLKGKIKLRSVEYNHQVYFYEPTRYKIENNRRVPEKPFVGHSQAGSTFILEHNQDKNTNLLLGEISFIPSNISDKEYEEILTDLIKIHEKLFSEDNSATSVQLKNQKYLELQNQVKNIENVINQIEENPNEKLVIETDLIHKNTINKFDIKNEIIKTINPSKQFFYARRLVESKNTKENIIIKQLLKRILKYTEIESEKDRFSYPNQQANNLFYFIKNKYPHLDSKQKFKKEYNKLDKNINYIYDEKEIRNVIENIKLKKFYTENLYEKEINVPLEMLFNDKKSLSDLQCESFIEGKGLYSHFSKLKLLVPERYSNNFRYIWCNKFDKESDIHTHYYINLLFEKIKKGEVKNISMIINYKRISQRTRQLVRIKRLKINNVEILFNEEEVCSWLRGLTFKKSISDEDLLLHAELEKFYYILKNDLNKQKTPGILDELKQLTNKLLSKQFFRNIPDSTFESLVPTQTFLYNPIYSIAWEALNIIHDNIRVTLEFNDLVSNVTVDKINNIYEVWVYYKLIEIMTNEMGWELVNRKSLKKKIIEYYSREVKHWKIELKTIDFNAEAILKLNDWQVNVYYEPRLREKHEDKNSYTRTPDFYLVFKYKGEKKGNIILDAKFKDYNFNTLTKEINDVAIQKYSIDLPKKIDDYYIGPEIIVSGIIYPLKEAKPLLLFPFDILQTKNLNIDLLKQNYPHFYDSNNNNNNVPHKYVSIPLSPNNNNYIINLIRMIMEYHFEDYQRCWRCGSEDLEEDIRYTKSNYPKKYYTCMNCKEFWVQTHCSKCGNTLLKHLSNFHREKDDNSWHVYCPVCNAHLSKEMN